MSKRNRKRRKHVAKRTCVGCRSIQPKRSMVRIVRTDDGVQVDLTGKMPGRGAYLHESRTCWEKGLKTALARSLKTDLTPNDLSHLRAFMETLPEYNHSEVFQDE